MFKHKKGGKKGVEEFVVRRERIETANNKIELWMDSREVCWEIERVVQKPNRYDKFDDYRFGRFYGKEEEKDCQTFPRNKLLLLMRTIQPMVIITIIIDIFFSSHYSWIIGQIQIIRFKWEDVVRIWMIN